MFNTVRIKKTAYTITGTKEVEGTVIHSLEGGKRLSIQKGGQNGEWTLSGSRYGRPTMTHNLHAVFA